jgi:hypothetical protein
MTKEEFATVLNYILIGVAIGVGLSIFALFIFYAARGYLPS